MRMSFKSHLLVEEDFSSFQQYLQQSGMTFPQLLQKLQSGQPTGKGSHQLSRNLGKSTETCR